jgi:pyridoxamine 5'-phosphate oxidase
MNGARIPRDVLDEFQNVFAQAQKAGAVEPTAMILATADAKGRPSSRAVLLKGVDERGFTFFTNLESRKALQLAENPRASLTFFWPVIERQIQIEGDVLRVDGAEADAYWATRPRESKIGAWASKQSRALESRDALLAEAARLEGVYPGAEVPRPPFWSGFRVVPDRIELWRGMPHRLHERVLHARGDDGVWTKQLLYP